MKRLFLILFLLVPLMLFGQAVETFTLDDGETVSDSVRFSKSYPISIIVPQGVSDSLKFQVSDVGTTWYPLLRDTSTTRYFIHVDSSQATAISLEKEMFYPWSWLKVESFDAASGDQTFRVQIIKRSNGR